MIPREVRAVAASTDTTGLAPGAQAINEEIVSGVVSPITMTAVALLHASGVEEGPLFDSIGGRPGAWWAATQAPALPARIRPGSVDDWIVSMMAEAPPDVWANAVAGSTRPSILRDFDKQADKLDSKLFSAIRTAISEALGDLIVRAGLDVMSSVRDASVADQLREHPLDEVVAAAHAITVKGGRSVMAVTALDLAALIQKASERLARRLRKIMEDADAEAVALYRKVFGTELVSPDPGRIDAAVAQALNEFDILAQQRLEPEDIETNGELVLGEQSSDRVGAGVITGLMALLTGGTLDAQGTVEGVAPSIVKRPGLAAQNTGILQAAGSQIAEARTSSNAARELIEAQLRSSADDLVRLRQLADEAEKALKRADDVARAIRARDLEIAKARLKDLRAEQAALRKERDALAVDARKRAADAREAAALTKRAEALAETLAEGRVEVQTVTIWVHGKEGTPSNPFEPHEALDGEIVGTDEFRVKQSEAFAYTTASNEARSTEPFALGAWFPGDHAGCTCGYDTETILITIADVPDSELTLAQA